MTESFLQLNQDKTDFRLTSDKIKIGKKNLRDLLRIVAEVCVRGRSLTVSDPLGNTT